jgi:hypothetical protein
VRLRIEKLPAELSGGKWREYIVDATHSNVWNDVNKAELFQGRSEKLSEAGFTWEGTLRANSITLVELTR